MWHIPLPLCIGFPMISLLVSWLYQLSEKNTNFANFPLLPFIKCLTTLHFLIAATAYLSTIIYLSTFKTKYVEKCIYSLFFLLFFFSFSCPFSKNTSIFGILNFSNFFTSPLAVQKIWVQLYYHYPSNSIYLHWYIWWKSTRGKVIVIYVVISIWYWPKTLLTNQYSAHNKCMCFLRIGRFEKYIAYAAYKYLAVCGCDDLWWNDEDWKITTS